MLFLSKRSRFKQFLHQTTFNPNVTRFYDVGQYFTWMLSVARTLLRMPRRPPLVSRFEYYEHLFHAVNILSECYHPLYILCQKLCDIQNFQTNNWPMKIQEITWETIILFRGLNRRVSTHTLTFFTKGYKPICFIHSSFKAKCEHLWLWFD